MSIELHRGRARPVAWGLLVGLLTLCATAVAAEKVRPGDAERAQAARTALDEALAVLDAPEAPAEAHAAARAAGEAALARLEALVDAYHHAPNLRAPTARPHVLALRPVIGRLFAADGPLTLHRDVIHPRPRVALPLARAAQRAGDRAAEIGWLRAALATAPDDRSALTALRAAHLALGDVPAANAVALRLRALDGAVSAPKPR